MKTFFTSILSYIVFNIIYNIVLLLEYLLASLLPIFSLINYILYGAAILCAAYVTHLMIDAILKEDHKIYNCYLIEGIFFVVFNAINLISVFFFDADYTYSYILLLLTGIVMIVTGVKKR
jgi:hypothetical protein